MTNATGSWPSRAPQPGDVALELLAPEWTAGILTALHAGPLRPAELQQRLGGIPHTTLMDRLRDLTTRELIARERRGTLRVGERVERHVEQHVGQPVGQVHGAAYALTDRGSGLEQVVVAAAVIERRRPDAESGRSPGERAVRVVADPYNRAIARLLGVRPLTLAQIERSLPRAAHSSLTRQLRELEAFGAATSDPQQRASGRLHDLTPHGRRLAGIVLLAARWERRVSAQSPMPSDIGGLIHLIAPLAQIPSHLEGVCRICIGGESDEPDIHISLAKGRISPLPLAPHVSFDAVGRSSADGWGQALLMCDAGGIKVTGDRVLLSIAVSALGVALRA